MKSRPGTRGYHPAVVRVGQRAHETGGTAVDLAPVASARSPAVEIFLWSRAAIWAVALTAFVLLDGSEKQRGVVWDEPAYTRDLGWATDIWARWDSVWFLRIAEHGYGAYPNDAAFFPLYPALVGGVGRLLGGHYLAAGIAVSLAAGAAAFALLWKLAEPRLGPAGARRALLYLALFPTSFYLGAVYSESLYLLLVVAAFLLAERGRFWEAAAIAGLALLTRSSAIALLPSLALLGWRARGVRGLLPACVAPPLIFLAYPLLLLWRTDDPAAFLTAQEHWDRRLSLLGPLGGVVQGIEGAATGVWQLLGGGGDRVYEPAAAELAATRVALSPLWLLAALGLFIALTIVVWRRFGAPYGLFAALSLALPLSTPSDDYPLLSLPRFGLVVFPLFLALAVLGSRPRVHAAIVVVSAALLTVNVVQWTLWEWVA